MLPAPLLQLPDLFLKLEVQYQAETLHLCYLLATSLRWLCEEQDFVSTFCFYSY